MPNRILQTLLLTLFGLTLLFTDKSTEACLWYIIPTGILAMASFVFGKLINEYWFAKYKPVLDDYEIKWVSKFIPYFMHLEDFNKVKFLSQLALELKQREFVSMTDKKLPEELKLMALAPAVRLGLDLNNPLAVKYHKIVFYHTAFPSPQYQYLHLSETFHEDGVLIFASDALQSAHVQPGAFFNTALYEWACVFIEINKLKLNFPITDVESWAFIENILHTEKKRLHDYMGIPELNVWAILIYIYVMDPHKLLEASPESYYFISSFID
ncbi:MAG: hypothetical protein WBO44_14535 [Saprospiraceae bacterium]